MKVDIDFIEYSEYKEVFLKHVKEGYRADEIKIMREHGISDDEIFIAYLIGLYKANVEMGLTK